MSRRSAVPGCPSGQLAAEQAGGELAERDYIYDPVKVDVVCELTQRGPYWRRLPSTWPGHPTRICSRRRRYACCARSTIELVE